ncbi:hypothetical protein [Vannielia litorea]|uniref:hypothetical protein n=1 Tax=Vannielia litorea TaxID=1217970 RepID=UPI001C957F6B|nr:hypothetical protein [Vannielia litorea]MBY6048027.1 hypothetical protein [Vannielia litorea]MBY6075441.1 hypothetical protein [Vannielia litorea]
MAVSKLTISSELPEQFVYELGVYLQTCAHIELTACSLICSLEHLKPEDEGFTPRFFELRKLKLGDLIKTLGKAATSLPKDDYVGLKDITRWFQDNQIYRHMAAHGAFQWLEDEKKLRIHYVHKRKLNKKTVYEPETRLVERKDVLSMVNDADRLLRILTGLDMRIISGDLILTQAEPNEDLLQE